MDIAVILLTGGASSLVAAKTNARLAGPATLVTGVHDIRGDCTNRSRFCCNVSYHFSS